MWCEDPVIRCSGTKATAEIQSDAISAPSLIAHAMCRKANLAHESEETARSLPVDTFQNHIQHFSVVLYSFIACLELTQVYIALTEGVNFITQTVLPCILEARMTASTISMPQDREKQ